MNLLILLQTNPITSTGGLSAGWAIVIMGGIISFLVGVLFIILNNTITVIKNDVASIKQDLHKFTEYQSGLNAKFEERTKDL